jgi:tetratricopeptide (TPR) repeat protein
MRSGVSRPFFNSLGDLVLNRESSPLARTLDALLFGSLLVLTFLLACFPNQDMDLWWHLKAGQAILAGGGIPTHDTYTIAAAGHDWIDLHWLFQTAVAFLHARGGMEALTMAAAAIAALALGAGILGSSTREVAPYLLVVWFPAILVMSSRFFVRPEIITLVCLAAYLGVLRRAETNPRSLWLLVPIQVLWVNVQGLFCFGPFLLACWLIDRWLGAAPEQRNRVRSEMALPTISVLLACFANPFGWRGAVYPLTLAQTMFIDGSFYREHILELASPLTIWQATAYRDPYVWAAGLLFAMTASSFLSPGVGLRVFRVAVFAVFSGLGLTAVRNLPQFALVAACIQSWNVAERSSRAEHARRYGFPFRIVSLAATIFLACSLVTGDFYSWIGTGRVFGFKEHPLWHAHDAAQFAAREGMPDRIVAFHEGQASVVEFHMRDQQRVYVDSRLEVMQRAAMESYYQLANAIARGDENWQDILNSPTTILIDHASHFPLEVTMLSDPDWTCAWFDAVAAVYVPKAAGSAPRDQSGNLALRHFGVQEHPSKSQVNTQDLRNGLNSDLMEASALLNIARAAGDRATAEGTDRRLLLLLAMRIARGAIDDMPHAACRIGANATFQMYAVPNTAPEDWQMLEIMGLARSRYLLQRCQELLPGDFGTLAEEYAVVSALGDADEIYVVSQQLAASKAQTAPHVRLQSLVKQNLNSAHFRATVGTGSLIDPAGDVDDQIGELFESRRFLRIKTRFAADSSPLSTTSRDRIAQACLVCGDPQAALAIWQQASNADEDSHNSVGMGIAHLVEQDHTRALEHFERAVHEEPSNVEAHCALAVCHLELGDARSAAKECDLALAVPEISEGMQEFCERMREFAMRYVRDAD